MRRHLEHTALLLAALAGLLLALTAPGAASGPSAWLMTVGLAGLAWSGSAPVGRHLPRPAAPRPRIVITLGLAEHP